MPWKLNYYSKPKRVEEIPGSERTPLWVILFVAIVVGCTLYVFIIGPALATE